MQNLVSLVAKRRLRTASVLQQGGGVRSFGIDLQGGKGNANNFPDSAPTLCAISHGTPNATLLFAEVPRFPFRPVTAREVRRDGKDSKHTTTR